MSVTGNKPAAEIKKPPNVSIHLLHAFRPPSRHKTPPKAVGLDLPERPHTPPETQKELEDLRGLSQTQHLQGLAFINGEINNNAKNSNGNNEEGSSDIETTECPLDNPKQEQLFSKPAIAPLDAGFTKKRPHIAGIPVRAWGMPANNHIEEQQEEQVKYVSMAKPSTACTNQLLGSYLKDTRYQHVSTNYINNISGPKQTFDNNNKPVRPSNIVGERPMTVVNNKQMIPKTGPNCVQLFTHWYLNN
jgi:hypothetical protein